MQLKSTKSHTGHLGYFDGLLRLYLEEECVMAKFSSSSSSYKIIVGYELVVSVQVKTSHDYVPDILLYKK